MCGYWVVTTSSLETASQQGDRSKEPGSGLFQRPVRSGVKLEMRKGSLAIWLLGLRKSADIYIERCSSGICTYLHTDPQQNPFALRARTTVRAPLRVPRLRSRYPEYIRTYSTGRTPSRDEMIANIRHPPFTIHHSPSAIRHLPSTIHHRNSAQ